MPSEKIFQDIADKVNDECETYRERWLNAKLSLYSSFLTFSGLTLAAAALVAQGGSNFAKIAGGTVVILTMVSSLFIFLQYHWLTRLYDALGFSQARFNSEQDVEKYYSRQRDYLNQFGRRKKLRRFMDVSIYLITIVQIVLLAIVIFKEI